MILSLLIIIICFLINHTFGLVVLGLFLADAILGIMLRNPIGNVIIKKSFYFSIVGILWTAFGAFALFLIFNLKPFLHSLGPTVNYVGAGILVLTIAVFLINSHLEKLDKEDLKMENKNE